MKPLFFGCGTALVTPFKKDGEIDFECFIKLIEFQIDSGVDALIVSGTTGEGSTLTVEEKLQLFDLAVKTVNKRVPVIAGTGSNSTSFALNLAKEAEKCGIDAHLIVTPYYNKCSQKGVIEHYFTLADKLTKPVMVYNVPSRTGVNISPETYRALSEHENIIGIKEADPDMGKLAKSIYLTEGKLTFYVGNDDLITAAASLGAKGVISVLSNIAPRFTSEMTKAAIMSETAKSAYMQKNAMALINALFSDVNPIPIKEAMGYLGFCNSTMRLPLCSMSPALRAKLIGILEEFKSIIY